MRLRTQLLLAFVCAAPSLALAQNTVGQVFASDASVKGSVVFASGGTQVLSGSQVAAGASAAILKLQRGGDVRICPGTNLSVATSPSGSELMLSLSSGSIETDYSVKAGADTILTPDFRMQMIGPGVFHLAIAADSLGNTCVRPLANNAASVIVTEVMGNSTYQVKPAEQVFFPRGKLDAAQNSTMQGCGCPAPPPPVQRAETTPPPKPDPVSVPRPAPPDTHVQVDAPFVFHGDAQQEPDLGYMVATLKTRGAGDLAIKLAPTVLSPEQAAKEQKKAQERNAKKLALEQEEARKSQQKIQEDLVRQQELARKEARKQEHAEARAQKLARAEQEKRNKAEAKQQAAAHKEQEKQDRKLAKQQQELARKEQQKREQAKALEVEIAKIQQQKIEQQRAHEQQQAKAAQEQNRKQESGGVFKKIGSFFGKIFRS